MTLMDKVKHAMGGDKHHGGTHQTTTDPRIPTGSGGSHTTDGKHVTGGDQFQHSNLGAVEGGTAGRNAHGYPDSSTTSHSTGSGLKDKVLGSGATTGRDPYDQTGTGVGGVGVGKGVSSSSGVGASTISTDSGIGSSTYGGGNVDHQMFHPLGKDGSGYSAEHLAEHTGHMSHAHGHGSTGTGAGVVPVGSTMGSGIGSNTTSGLGSDAGSGVLGSTISSGTTGSHTQYEGGDMSGRTNGTDQDAYGSATGLGSARDGYVGRAPGVADENNTLRR